MTDRVKLKPGDYVSTEGMDEEQYGKIVAMMRNSGACDRHAYPSHAGRTDHYLMWDDENDIDGGPCIRRCSGRHLTIDQVLGTDETSTSPIQTLKNRRKERDDAEAAYQDALKAVREDLGDGFTLDDNAAPVRDLPPEEWREGDVVVLDNIEGHPWVKRSVKDGCLVVGETYTIGVAPKHRTSLRWVDLAGFATHFESSAFRFHSRPA